MTIVGYLASNAVNNTAQPIGVSPQNPLPVAIISGGGGGGGTFTNDGTFAKETGGNLATIATNTPPLGQALAAASVPVILPAATITALTPPASITNYSQETGGNLATIASAITASKMQVNITNASLAVTGTFWQSTQPVSIATAPVLVAGSAVIGKVGIDQTTPGTTNLVQINQLEKFGTTTAFTITLASLASSVVGVGRQSTLVTSNTARSALIGVQITVGTSPTANTLVSVYLIRGNGTINDDGAGASDAGLTVVNAPLLGNILITATTSNAVYTALFDTKFLGSLGPSFGIAVVNSSGASLNATAGNLIADYQLIT
jgi:hypothetical protein